MEVSRLFKILPLFTANYNAKERTVVNQGGTSSGKTYSLMQVLYVLAMSESAQVITIVGQDVPNLKKGAYRDANTIRNNNPILQKWFPDVNEGERLIKCVNGSILEFSSFKDAQDAKSGKRDYLFINEANGISYEIYWQLAMRTRKKVFLDYNPSARFWVHDEVIGRENVKLIISDHRKNYFLTKEEHDRIEGISDPELWKVYARGLTGMIEGLVLTNWDICDQLPPEEEWKMSCFGLDFGFSNDPSALERVVLAHGELWIDELIYSTGLTNPDIAVRAKEQGVSSQQQIIADCAEPKSIRELQAAGLWVTPSTKGNDSIVAGLDILKRYRLHVTRRSQGLISNLRAYKWGKDKDGNNTNKPEDKNNHGIDAIRYVGLAKLAEHREVRGVRRRN
ncbi:MAG: terminase large subunit [Alistipes sp.]|nr:terminase large subunit [Alistipes sp.]